MGNYVGTASPEVSDKRGKKRPLDESREEEKERLEEQNFHTPKRKKMKSTSKYIYQTLFVDGKNSDVTISALNKDWHLHKVYLCQSGYFSSMFSGSWKETTLSTIHMDIPDENIDEDALNVAFGSLYKDDVVIKPARVASILAAATLLQLEGLIQQCADIMKETISSKTVCGYHLASQMYGQQCVSQQCIEWLEKNLMTSQVVNLLREISAELLEQVVKSPNLFVMQVEMDVYTMLRKWLFLQLTPSWSGSSKSLAAEADAHFKKRAVDEKCCFLETEEGQPFANVFKGIRYQHVINDLASAKLLDEDSVVPQDWLLPIYKTQWQQMLRMEQHLDRGPVDENLPGFLTKSMRCGRVLKKEGEYCWRWTGYSYGIDLLVSFTNRLIIFKRNTLSQSCPSSVNLNPHRHLLYRVTVAWFNTLGQTEYIKSSGIKKLTIGKDEDAVIMDVDRHVPFPLHISVNILSYTPHPSAGMGEADPEESPPPQAHNDSIAPNPPVPQDAVEHRPADNGDGID